MATMLCCMLMTLLGSISTGSPSQKKDAAACLTRNSAAMRK